MNLENTVKYHFAKSTLISDSPRATGSDSLTGTDVMAAMGMTQERAALGYSAFLGKMGISNNDRERAIELLAQYALTKCDRVAALRKLEPGVKPLVMHQFASFAFEDYSRSAASVKQCDGCKGEGFVDAEVFSMKSHTPAKEKKFVKMSLNIGVENMRPAGRAGRLHAFSAGSVRARRSLVVPAEIAMDAGKPLIRFLLNSRVCRFWLTVSAAVAEVMSESHQLRLTPRCAR